MDQPSSDSHKTKVLVIEDDKATQLLYGKIFLAEKFDVHFADDGEAGLEQYQSLKPSLIILDMMLPVVTGFVVLKSIREKFKDTKTQIYVSTSLSSKEDIVECGKMGIQGYIIKPFDFKELRTKFAGLAL